jgi:c-di-GMP-binding flagellar brake protein YcgR
MTPRTSPDPERRTAARQAVTYRLDVIVPDGSSGCLLDLSLTGMRIRFRSEVDLAAIQRLELEFPRWLELGRTLQVSGRFVWVRAADNGATEAGFAFDGLSRKEESVIQVLIQRLAEALAEDRAAVAVR